MEGIVMLLRLLGLEDDAIEADLNSPFDDVPEWARPYVAYAFARGYTKGVSETKFDSHSTLTATQFLTFMLRALGFRDGEDFQWDSAWTLTDELGITNGQFNADNNEITRADMVEIAANTLVTMTATSGNMLIKDLVAAGILDEDAAEAFIKGLAELITPTPTPTPAPSNEATAAITMAALLMVREAQFPAL
jgi:polyhydroxyalkanoate synthesis regulator phasin